MKKLEVLSTVLLQDRLIRLNLDMLEGISREIKSDIEEGRILLDAFFDEADKKKYETILLQLEEKLLLKISEILDHIYDIYEVFNFDLTFLSSIPEELERELERLDAISSINTKLELIVKALDEILLLTEEKPCLRSMLTPFRVYKEVIKRTISFNKTLHKSSPDLVT